jgi:3',5'-cyclic AMP phosphodiesterase CpdA
MFLAPPPPIGPLAPHLDVAKQAMRRAAALLSQFPRERTYIVAGNHDLGLWGNLYFPEYEAAFDELLWRPINGGKVVLQLNHQFGNPLVLPKVADRIPVVFTIAEPGIAVQLVMLHSTPQQDVFPPPIWASGKLGGEQLNRYRAFVTPDLLFGPAASGTRQAIGTVRVVAFHHHPWEHAGVKKLEDADELLTMLRTTADLVLFGHKHVQKYFGPATPQALGIRHGALASGWIRSEATAAEIVINSATDVRVGYVPIA